MHVAHQQARRSARVEWWKGPQLGEPRAHGEHLLAREQQGALVERLDDLHVGRLKAIPQDHIARGEGELSAALANELDASANELEPEDVFGAPAHHRPAAVSQERRGRAVDEAHLADPPSGHRAAELDRRAVGRPHVECQMRLGED